MTNSVFKHTVLAAVLAAMATTARAQQPPTETTNVEVEPITCWWRTTTSAVRAGEAFSLTLTCAVVETESTKVVPDLSRLDPTVVQLPPFEILGGTHAGDLTLPGKRFFQYDYKMRVIAEETFGADVAVPPLEITYRIESKVSGGDSVQGRDLIYSLPRTSIRVVSLVPNDTTDIREAPAAAFGAIESRVSRANLFQTLSTLLVALAGFVLLAMLVGVIRRRTAQTGIVRHLLTHRAIIGGAARELADVQRESRGGWTPELVARALTALRIAGSYATGRAVGQRVAEHGVTAVDGELLLGGRLGRAKACVSGSVTGESAGDVPGLADALRTLTTARYGRPQGVGGAEPPLDSARGGFGSAADDAVGTAIRIARQQASKHSVVAEWTGTLVHSAIDLRKRVWA